ncbi:GNAT family N-acetyltransferase [Yinghuangia seranimata]|uniref:GNAT family N-acetyltransferase n=1 Tax=Yinghuangia seranimata TaxID=408067 RepID=UPI00248C4088|nr:GNAT family N-acetyltransferase [Yinghuangia seranimata]MDI2129257.1 GNAT family N-acetyltransferase [Yinghuangia seranimata]
MRIERVDLSEIFQLRWDVLRPGWPREAAEYPTDAVPGCFHMAMYDDTDTVVSCVTFFPEDYDGRPAYRFRGMGTVEALRGKGLGADLLTAALAECAKEGGTLAWCNGRTSARNFYERLGFTARGDEFLTADTKIPHYVFTVDVQTQA